jgi:hypothetical protein
MCEHQASVSASHPERHGCRSNWRPGVQAPDAMRSQRKVA